MRAPRARDRYLPWEGYLVMTKPAPLLAAIIVLGLSVPGALAQLPQTNMGKYVHKPGDNQYDKAAQSERHPPPPPPVTRFVTSGGGGGGYMYRPKPKPRKPDPSVEPIASDEPVPPAGFPVLPERLELPIAMGSWGGAGSSGGGGGGGSWSADPQGGGASDDGPPRMLSKKQGYGHFEPGAFIPKNHKSGYYKCNEVTPPHKQVSDQIMTGNGGGAVPGLGGPPSPAGALKSLGKEPKLNDREDGAAAPDAPQPVVINQSTTQDLSLPEDDFSGSSAKRPSKVGRKMKQVGRRVVSPINSASRRFTGVSLF